MNQATFPFLWVQKALERESLLKRKAQGDSDFVDISTDSRKVSQASLFLALKGENWDGHDFLLSAVQSGAKGIVGERITPEIETACKKYQASFFEVTDGVQALRALAKAWREKFSIPIAVVIGNVGKTTSKEMLAALLSGRDGSQVLRTEASQNGFLGVPMTLLQLRPQHTFAVVEIGIDEMDAMKKHMDLTHPTHLLLTSVGEEHLEKLGDVQTAAKEELEGVHWMLHQKRPSVLALHQELLAKTFLLSPTEIRNKRDLLLGYALPTDSVDPKFKALDVTTNAGKLRSPLPGIHNERNLLGALTLARVMGLNESELHKGLMSFLPPKGRSSLQTVRAGATFLCDYYNSNPSSIRASLELVEQIRHDYRKIYLCLGDMRELGDQELKFHEDLRDPILQVKPEGVFLLGPLMKALEKCFRSARSQTMDVIHFESHDQIIEKLKSLIQPKDLVLIKGSRGMKMEKIWEAFAD